MSSEAAPRAAMGSFDRLHIRRKLTLLGVVFALLFAIPTTLFLTQVGSSLLQSHREIEGLERSEAALGLLRSAGQHRALAAAVLAGDAALSARREEAAGRVGAAFGRLKDALDPASREGKLLAAAAAAWQALVPREIAPPLDVPRLTGAE